jgi:hypothetical protein
MVFSKWNAEDFWQQRVSPSGLAVFRICYGMVLLWEVADLCRLRHLIFDPLPYIESGPIWLSALLPCWLVVVALLLAGCFTRIAAMANYVCSVIVFGSMTDYEYHFDHICQGINFLLLFAPVSETWSIDAWLRKRAGKVSRAAAGVHPIYYFLFMVVGIGLIYIDSVLWKLKQPDWQNGYGVWRPMSSPPFTWYPTAAFQMLLNQHWFMQLSNYLTLFLETTFLFLMWSRRCRLWLLLPLGLTLHLGIMLAFPIPKFSLVMVALYLLVVPPKFWDRWRLKLNRCSDHLLPNRVQATGQEVAAESLWNHRYAISGALALLITLGGLQSLIILQDHQLVNARKFTLDMRMALNRYMGLCMHGVFLDPHWNNYNHVVAVVQQRQDGSHDWLPITSQTGQMGSLSMDRLWTSWAFRSNMPGINNAAIERSVKRLTAYWLATQNHDLHEARFLVLTKALRPCSGWRENELSEQMQMPWQVSGEVRWHDNQCVVKLTTLGETKPLDVSAVPLIPLLVSPFVDQNAGELLISAQQIHVHR